jgi:4-aminobutyrate aminotransferase-like enzyme
VAGCRPARTARAGSGSPATLQQLRRHLIVLTAGSCANVVRIIPPLVTTAAEVDLALSVIDASLAAARA